MFFFFFFELVYCPARIGTDMLATTDVKKAIGEHVVIE